MLVLRFEDQQVPRLKLTNVFLLNFTLCMTMPQAAGKKMFLQSYITDAVLSFLVFWYRLSTKFERGRWLTNNNRPYFFFLSEVMRCYLMRPATRIVTMSQCYLAQAISFLNKVDWRLELSHSIQKESFWGIRQGKALQFSKNII